MIAGLDLIYFAFFANLLCGEKEEVRFLQDLKNRSPPGLLKIPLPPTDYLVQSITNKNYPHLIKQVIPEAKDIYVIAHADYTIIRYS